MHMCLAVTLDFPFSKCVCKSQKRKCVCKAQYIIQNLSVSHKIKKCVFKSQNSHIQIISEGGKQRIFVNGLQWSLLVPGVINVEKLWWNLVKHRKTLRESQNLPKEHLIGCQGVTITIFYFFLQFEFLSFFTI